MIIKDFTDYSVFSNGDIVNNKTGKVLKPLDNGNGYKYVSLYKNKRAFRFYIHRIVATHFLDNPNGLKYVNHKDENKTNNSADNLEWCTAEYNANYGTKSLRQAQSRGNSIKAFKDGVFVGVFYSERQCAKELNIQQASLNRAIRGFQKTAGGHTFEYDI